MAEQDKPKRRKRTYPHGSGDRNVWSPFGKERMPVHEGGTQRVAPPAPGPRKPKPKPGER